MKRITATKAETHSKALLHRAKYHWTAESDYGEQLLSTD